VAASLYAPEVFHTWRLPEMQAYALVFASALSGLESALDDPAAFRTFCQQYPERELYLDGAQVSPDLGELALGQWFLEPGAPSRAQSAAEPLLDERFEAARWGDELPEGWAWHDPFGDCRHALQDGLAIEAANGRDLWKLNQSAPRLLVALSSLSSGAPSGVAVETVCAPAADDRPALGGLVLWIDGENYLRLDRGLSGPDEITLIGCLQNRDALFGRGRLPLAPDGTGLPDKLGRAWLRFEWQSGMARALCSADGETWYTAGQVELPFTPDAHCGVYARGTIDRTIYQGAYPEGAGLRFESLRCWAIE
jgi:hypothetical protein